MTNDPIGKKVLKDLLQGERGGASRVSVTIVDLMRDRIRERDEGPRHRVGYCINALASRWFNSAS